MKKILFIFIMLLCTSISSWAQKQISGVVTTGNNEPLQAVTVGVKGTTVATITDEDGAFSLNVPADAERLIFNYIGKEPQTVEIGTKDFFNISMEDGDISLDEVVAIGYSTVKKSDLTGSVAHVSTKLTEQRAISSPEQLLQGVAPGVQVTSIGGAPGADVNVSIRGGNSLNASNQPLYIIDGMEMNSSSSFYDSNVDENGSTPPPSPLSMINPNDIESINILKDASASAIYGSRGANGVIIITTKKGRAGTSIIQLDVGTTMSKLRNKIDVLNSQQWTQLYDEAAVNDGLDPIYGDPSDLSTYEKYTRNINWQDEIYRTAYGKDINLSIRGGKGKMNYNISGNYNDTEGLIITSEQRRMSLRSGMNVDVNKFFKVGVNTYFSNTLTQIVPYSNKGVNGFYSPIMMAVQYRAYDLTWNDYYDINTDDFIDDGTAPYNPATQIKNTTDEQRLNFAQANTYVELGLTEWLKFKSTLGFNYSDGLRNSFWGEGTRQGDLQNNIVSRLQMSNFDYLNENTLSFDKTFDKHKINGVVGASTHKWIRKRFSAKASGFEITSLGYESFTGADIVEVPVTTHTEWGLASFYGRFNYHYDDRYLVTLTGRYDGSSHFTDGNKWGFFPSVALAWKVTSEEFMKELKTISELKLRLSYGASGNQAINVLETVPTLISGGRYPITDQFLPGVGSSTYLYNQDLTWETTYQGNIGLDVGLFENRLNITADLYKKNTKDLLLTKIFPTSSGFTTTRVNGGEIQNKGFELSINGDIMRKRDLRWSMGVTLSQNRSKVIDLDGVESMYGEGIAGIGGYPNISHVGRTVGLFYGYQTDGIYQTADQATGAPTQAGQAPEAGDRVFVDQLTVDTDGDGIADAGDGMINDDDKVIIGNPEADLFFGFNTSVEFKGFTLSMIFNGSIGNDVLNLNKISWEGMQLWDGRYNQATDAFNGRWVNEETPASYPKASLGRMEQDYLDIFVENGSFIRLQNISLGYTFNPKWLSGVSLRPYISASNLFVITKYSGYDPEIKGLNSALNPGIDLGAYPMPSTFKIGFSMILK
ncbi:MAG: SusC/RagA family TonB-linked outer membrane protein [Bacteroidales bacterium]